MVSETNQNQCIREAVAPVHLPVLFLIPRYNNNLSINTKIVPLKLKRNTYFQNVIGVNSYETIVQQSDKNQETLPILKA